MKTTQLKANVGMTLVILFLVTLATGIILHLKSHGIILQPRATIKIIHWVAGFLMVIFACWHGNQFSKMLKALRNRSRWFVFDTWGVVAFLILTFATGIVKLLSPVKIPHLGLWHYYFGGIMTILICIHLVKGLPSWNRLRKIK